MKWSEKTWNEAKPIYNSILQLPFITSLMKGTLDKDCFLFYLQQDALYLSDYGRILTGIASKLSNPKQREAFINFATDTIVVENALHESFFKEINSRITKPSPSCLLYISYLFKHLANSPVEVVAAAVLPCFWIYQEVGNYILTNQIKKNNPYQDWINTYGSKDFEKAVTLATSICDDLADQCTTKQQEQMTEAFVMCSKFEWMFWDSAYKKETWKI